MNKRALLVLLLLALLLGSTTLARADAPAHIIWSTLSGGGGPTSSTHYTLQVSIGQPAAGLSYSTNFRLGGGFCYILGLPRTKGLFLPILVRKYP